MLKIRPILLAFVFMSVQVTSVGALQYTNAAPDVRPSVAHRLATAGGLQYVQLDEFPEEKLASLKSFSVSALSRGSGVPEASSELIVALRQQYQMNTTPNEVTGFTEERIGLEGETRLCIVFSSAESAKKAWKDVQLLIGNKELIDLRAEECPAR